MITSYSQTWEEGLWGWGWTDWLPDRSGHKPPAAELRESPERENTAQAFKSLWAAAKRHDTLIQLLKKIYIYNLESFRSAVPLFLFEHNSNWGYLRRSTWWDDVVIKSFCIIASSRFLFSYRSTPSTFKTSLPVCPDSLCHQDRPNPKSENTNTEH